MPPITTEPNSITDSTVAATGTDTWPCVMTDISRDRAPSCIPAKQTANSTATTAEARLRFYAEHYDTVEVDSSYYAIPAERTVYNWGQRTPPGFVFHIKAFGLMTGHRVRPEQLPADLRALVDEVTPQGYVVPSDALRDRVFARFRRALDPLRAEGKLGGVLFQLPPFSKFNAGRLSGLLEVLAGQTIVPGLRTAVEVRHSSWLCDECFHILRFHHAALVFADLASCPVMAPVTADFIYVRRQGTVSVGYPASSLREDARRIRAWRAEGKDVHVYFNNDSEGHAVHDARKLGKLLQSSNRAAEFMPF